MGDWLVLRMREYPNKVANTKKLNPNLNPKSERNINPKTITHKLKQKHIISLEQ